MSRARSLARRYALQALYQWQLNPQSVTDILAQFESDEEQDITRCDITYFRELLRQVVARLADIDQQLAGVVDRPLAELDPVERTALRIGAYELLYRIDVPYRVVINEAVDLTKRFGATAGHKYVNSVLDRIAVRARSVELRQGRAAGAKPTPRRT
jgi:N utilization substance protein B